MERKLKAGDSFDVVECLTNGDYGKSYKIGGHTVGLPEKYCDGLNLVQNGEHAYEDNLYFYTFEYKPIGKLTITKLK